MTSSYVATGPEDLIALAPTVLRFDPEDSVVVMTFGRPGRSFHARVALPRRPEDQDEVAETVLRAMRNNHLLECAILLYSHDRRAAVGQARKLNRRLRRAGIRVVDVLLVSGNRYFRVLRGDEVGTPFDISAHPFTARRVLDGVVVHKSRADLAQTLMPDPSAGDELAQVATRAGACLAAEPEQCAEADWIRSLVRTVSIPEAISDAGLPRLLAGLLTPDLIDIAWAEINRSNAQHQVELWTAVVRRSPDAYVAAPACLLAFAAWLAGDGALAWCGLDRCGPEGPPMARMLSELLHAAVPPSMWPDLSAEELRALRGPAA